MTNATRCRRWCPGQTRGTPSENVRKVIDDSRALLPELSRRINRTYAYFDSTSRMQWSRIWILDFLLPLFVGIVALWKVYSLVPNAIVSIWTA